MAGCEDRDRGEGKKKKSNNGEEEDEVPDHREFFLEHRFLFGLFQRRIKGERKGNVDDIVCICELIARHVKIFCCSCEIRICELFDLSLNFYISMLLYWCNYVILIFASNFRDNIEVIIFFFFLILLRLTRVTNNKRYM